MSYSRIFSEFIRDTSFESLPGEVRKAARSFILNLLGVIYSGSKSESAKKVERIIRRSESQREATVIPAGFKTSCLDAALVNGTFANAVCLNDIHAPSGTHLGPPVVPVALAVGEKIGSTGREILTAVTLGCEIMGRVGKAIHPFHQERGFHATATCGAFGAAATASKLLGLNVEETIWALGNAGSQASGLYAFLDDGAMAITIYPGLAARNGLFAALLAKKGFTGPEYIFESKEGFLKAMADTSIPEKLCDGIGKDYQILYTGIKPYACCRLIHSSIDAVLGILKEHPSLKPEGIDSVVVNISPPAANRTTDYHPQTPIGVRFSLPFNLAFLLLSGKAPVEPVPAELMDNQGLKHLLGLIKIAPRPEFPRYRSEVEITTTEGKIFLEKVEIPKGDPENPLTPDGLKNKFRALVEGNRLGEDRIQDIFATLDRLEEVQNIATFIEKLVQ